MMILTQYEKEYTASFFMDDYSMLPFQVFANRIYLLKGTIGEIFAQRNKLVYGTKMSKEERAYARKFITPAIEEYLDERNNKSNEAYAQSLLTGFRDALTGGV